MRTPLVDDFKEAMAALASGVCVVTTIDGDDAPRGFAATSVTSVSMRPPLLLVCQAKTSRSYGIFSTCKHLTVNVLAAGQQELAARFSSTCADRFADTGFVLGPSGTPHHPAALASVECVRQRTVDAGDHSVLLAEVLSVRTRPGEPLVYHHRRYQRMLPVQTP